jgi:carboxyl-terminal processing protease
LVLIAVLLTALSFLAFSKTSASGTENPKQKLLTTVTDLVEKQHYAPQKIDDIFSKKIFAKYVDELDGDRILFTEADVNSLKKYETILDDEMHGKDIEFIPAINIIYNKRTDEIIAQQKEILAKPFDFTIDENFIVDGDKLPYAKTDADKKDRLRKKLKLMTLERYSDLIDQREKSTIDSIKNQTNAQLEVEARTKVQKAVDKIYNRIKTKYNDDERFNAYINLITTQMDPHTDYFPPVEKRAFDEMMSGKFYGIGAQLQETDGNIKIAALMPNYPAQRSGEIVVGDVIVKVAQATGEAVEITGYEISDAVKLIRGKKDSEVKLTIKKQDGTTKIVSIIRAEIVQDESYVRSAVVTESNGDKIGYIYLPDFYFDVNNENGARCSVDVANEIIKLKRANVKGITLDLRFNGGGSLGEVIQMVGLFIPNGPVVQVRDKSGKATALDDYDPRVLYDGPLVVMVNEFSASASEIFAAAIQDYGRGIIVGSSTTYGKGTVQKQVSLNNNAFSFSNNTLSPDMGSVKITFQKFYRISGASTQLKGVTPDVIIPDMYDYLKIREKDNTAALGWDEIAKAKYTTCKDNFNNVSVIKKATDEIAANATFKLIKDNSNWLGKKLDEPRSLQLTKYKDYQKMVAATVAQNTNVLKTKTELAMDVTKEDYDKFYNNTDKAKGERYQAWLKNLKTDLYLNQTLNIVKAMMDNSLSKASVAY